MSRKIRYGMVGGGRGAFIGAVHRIAAALDQQIELVCGALSSDPERSRASGADLFLPPDRCYGTFQEMIKGEARRPEGERMDFIAIVTPNHMHFPPAKMALENGFHVLSDKPATLNLAEAKKLAALVKKSGLLFGLTHNYTGYPLVKEARDMIRDGKLGPIRKVVVEYPQGWLATRLEATGQKQAAWRTDPKRSGAAGCIGDIGTHAENLAEYITGLQIEELAADLTRRCGLADLVEHRCGDILDGLDETYDAVVSFLCFLHITDRPRLLANCRAVLAAGGALYIEDYAKRREPTATEAAALEVKVQCPSLPSAAQYEAQLRTAGFVDIQVEDVTEQWTGFTAGRLEEFRAGRDRNVAVHGLDIVDGLDDFYSTVAGLFATGVITGLKIVAR